MVSDDRRLLHADAVPGSQRLRRVGTIRGAHQQVAQATSDGHSATAVKLSTLTEAQKLEILCQWVEEVPIYRIAQSLSIPYWVAWAFLSSHLDLISPATWGLPYVPMRKRQVEWWKNTPRGYHGRWVKRPALPATETDV